MIYCIFNKKIENFLKKGNLFFSFFFTYKKNGMFKINISFKNQKIIFQFFNMILPKS